MSGVTHDDHPIPMPVRPAVDGEPPDVAVGMNDVAEEASFSKHHVHHAWCGVEFDAARSTGCTQ